MRKTLRKNVSHNFSFANHVYLFSYELSQFRYFARVCLECLWIESVNPQL